MSYLLDRWTSRRLRSRSETCNAVVFVKITTCVAAITLFIFYSSNENYRDARQMIAVVVPTRSQQDWVSAKDASLLSKLLPSLARSLTQHERRKYSVELVIVYDTGDRFWENSEVTHQSDRHSVLPLHFLSVRKSSRIPHNEGCRAAYELGAEYIVRVNDDTEFRGKGWLTGAVHALESFTPPRLGVVGPTCKEGNRRILTHDMVHRTHLEIFGDYYPPEFDNWWLDDWISKVYGEHNTRKLHGWVVVHRTDTYGTRYDPNVSQKDLLPRILVRSKQQIIDHLIHKTRLEC